jgi:cytochrome c-type biogenesis protein CcmH/NrfF
VPTWILWLSPVIVAPMIAAVWSIYAARPRGPEQALETVQEYDRFKAALTNPIPDPRRANKEASR